LHFCRLFFLIFNHFLPMNFSTNLFQVYALRCIRLMLCLLFCLSLSCADNKAKNPEKAINNHQKMIQTLADLQQKFNVRENTYAAEAKLNYYNDLMGKTRDPNEQLTILMKCAMIFLEYGDEQKSVQLLENILQTAGSDKAARKIVLNWLGTAYLRLGERENCLLHHSEDACVMPIQGKGVHQIKRGAKKAAECFETLLAENPGDYDAIWLLNIAYMALGEYPQKVPKQWLIPNLNKSEHTVSPFFDMAGDLRVISNDRAGGSIVEDFDKDGFLDLVTSAWDLSDRMHFFKNNGDGTFSDRSTASGLNAFTGGLNIQQTDYNNDGLPDIWVLRGAWQGQEGPSGKQPNSLLRNNGDGTFTDVTIDAGLLSFYPTQTSTWNDFNNDGWLDVFIGNETITQQNIYLCELFINNKNGTFTNVAKEWGLEVGVFAKGVTSGDYDKNGWPDIFVSAMSGHKLLFRNLGFNGERCVFENVTVPSGFGKENYPSFPTWFFDYDNDGWLDIFVCNYEFDKTLSYYAAKEALRPSSDPEGKPFIYRNNGDGTFTNVSNRLGLNKVAFSMGSNFGDINNDGWLDFYLATGNPSYQSLVPNKLFVNLGGQKFADATVSSRTGNLQKGHGVSIADLDNDGDQDIHVKMGGAYRGDAFFNSFYMNPGQNTNNWIYLTLEGVQTNRLAIGAKITVKFRENGKERMIYRELNSGGSFGASPFRREIGIGRATVIDEISIQWPVSGLIQTLKNVEPNQHLKIKEGVAEFEKLPVQKLTFKRADGSIPMCAPVQ
jgi:tetratricopeptide (TPR) repeat protein